MDSRVSIIIPVFNRFFVADRAIKSVLNQTYTNWELFVIDDCSKDEYILPDECNSFIKKITLKRNSQNIGPGLTRQVGLELSVGNYVCFLDSDDYYDPFFLERMIKEIELNHNIAGVYCTAFDLVTNSIRKSSNFSYNKILPTLFDEQRPWATCSWLWRRDCIGTWSELRTNQDSKFEIDVAIRNNSISHVSDVLCFIDKGTELNTIDLVGNEKNELNRNQVVTYVLKNINKFKYDRDTIFKSAINRLIYVSARLLKFPNQHREVWRNAKLLFNLTKPQKSLGLILIVVSLLSFVFGGQCGYRFLERFRNRYL
jgi:glycosyltransferase involved in cell wall biosynthesis